MWVNARRAVLYVLPNGLFSNRSTRVDMLHVLHEDLESQQWRDNVVLKLLNGSAFPMYFRFDLSLQVNVYESPYTNLLLLYSQSSSQSS